MARDKRNYVLVVIVIVLALSVGAAVLILNVEGIEPQQPVTNEKTKTFPMTPSQATVAQLKKSQHLDHIEEALPDTGQETPYLNREVKARLTQVADVYAEQIQYPTFSIPIPNHEALQKYLPNRSIGAERLLDIENKHSPRIRLQTDKLHYFTGDTINATVSIGGLSGHHKIQVEARLIAQGQTLATTDVSTVDPEAAIYQMSFSDLDVLTGSSTDEYRVVAQITIEGKAYEIGTPVSYVASVATVTDVGMAQVSGEYLYIPVNVTISKPGYHELAANLYATKSNKPLLHLSVQQELQTTNDLMQLKAHISALKVQGDAGPYRLQDISLVRMPSPPDFTSEYGNATQDTYPVNGYDFEEYDDLPYMDEEAQKRLEFLRQAGKVN